MRLHQINDLLAKLHLITLLSSAAIVVGYLLQPYLALGVRPAALFGLLGPVIGFLGLGWAVHLMIYKDPLL